MKKIILSLIFIIFFISFVSSEIIINQQPKELYNLGDIVTIPVTIKSLGETSGVLQMDIICSGQEINFYKNGIGLSGGEEKRVESQLVLVRVVIGELIGDCKIKVMLNEDYKLTNEFVISNSMIVRVTSKQIEFEPGKGLFIKGNVVKESGEGANGFIELQILEGNASLMEHLETIRNGFFSINISLPVDMKAGAYFVRLNAYEKDLERLTTNHGLLDLNIGVKQIPSNLEIILENREVNPGEIVKIKTILHDQTGVIISSRSFITIKDKDNIIREQTEKPTGEFLEFPIAYNEPPSNWGIVAVSNRLTSEADFIVKEKEEVKVELINKTLIITNIGNVLYNKSVLVKIENESLNVNVYLDTDESKKYFITAPNGEYKIEIMTEEGNKITGMAILTGREIGIIESSGGIKGVMRKPFVWIVVIILLGFVVLLIFRKIRKKNFFGFISKISRKKKKSLGSTKKNLLHLKSSDSIGLSSKDKAELSLSIKGEKQDVSVTCLKIKNLEDIKSKEDIRNTLQKINETVKEHKAVIYESQDVIFFMLVPLKTKTFRNEQAALKIAQGIKEILRNHNKLFKHKIDFGISLNHGSIIAKQEKSVLKFMSMGTLIMLAKKIASFSKGEILLSEKINERISRFAKTEKQMINDIPVYRIREMKDSEEHKNFIRNFLKRMESDSSKGK